MVFSIFNLWLNQQLVTELEEIIIKFLESQRNAAVK